MTTPLLEVHWRCYSSNPERAQAYLDTMAFRVESLKDDEHHTPRNRWFAGLVWGFSCQAVVLGFADSFLFGAGKAVFRPVACDQVRGARGRGQGTETVAQLSGFAA